MSDKRALSPGKNSVASMMTTKQPTGRRSSSNPNLNMIYKEVEY